eukprot:scaffold7428_cov153-Amphora_coffeaeformis.AAC.7
MMYFWLFIHGFGSAFYIKQGMEYSHILEMVDGSNCSYCRGFASPSLLFRKIDFIHTLVALASSPHDLQCMPPGM